MTFLEAFLWGSGLSIGGCVGLVAWLFLKNAAYIYLGVDSQWETMRLHETECLAALLSRNDLTTKTNAILQHISDIKEFGYDWSSEDEDKDEDEDGDDSEAWKNGRHQP